MTTAPVEPVTISTVARCGLALLGIALFFTGIDNYGQAVWGFPAPVFFVVVFAGAAAVLVAVAPRRPLALLASPVAYWLFAFFLLTTAWAIPIDAVDETLRELASRYRSIAFLVAFAIVFDDGRARRFAMWAVAGSVAIAAVLNVAELMSVVSFAEIPTAERTLGRSAGFYVNPNVSAFAIALGLAVVTEHVPRFLRSPLLILGMVGVAATFSRGGMICLALAFAWLAYRGALGSWRLVLTAVLTMAVLVGAFELSRKDGLLNENTAARVELAKDDSGRLEVAREAWELFSKSPLVGNGLGSTYLWENVDRPHDMYLNLGADQGIIGMLLFPALGVALAYRRRSALAFTLAFMAGGFFSHNLLEDRSVLLLIALVAAAGLDPEPHERTSHADEGSAPRTIAVPREELG